LVRYRTRVGALLGLLVLLNLITTDIGSITGPRYIDAAFDILGALFLIVGVLGRLWCTLYIGGKKNKTLQCQGPYSFVRHPLYFFSFNLGLGVSISSENVLVFALVMIYFWWQYRVTIRHEEKHLLSLFGDEYKEYCKRVPCFVPNLRSYDATPPEQVNMVAMRKEAVHGLFFLLFIPIVECVAHTHVLGVLSNIRL
jgi:protein-S-isoprenylcysteine O-methyltransferase Ste14